MLKFLSFFFTLFLAGCAKDNIVPDPPVFRITSITAIKSYETKVFYFHYDDHGLLESVDVPDQEYQIIYHYDKYGVAEIFSQNTTDGHVAWRDSITYQKDGRVNKVFKSNGYAGNPITLKYIYESYYNDEENITELKVYDVRHAKYIGIYKTYWENGNAKKGEDYDGEGILELERYIQYDNKLNFKKGNPYLALYRLPDNNITWSKTIDHTGLYDPYCNPCTFSYQYDLLDRVEKIIYPWNETWILSY